MTKINIAKTIRLRDGRTLAYAEFGEPSGKTLFYFHGGADCRLEARLLTKQAKEAGINLIGIDRPGMGLSSFKAGRRLLDWPDDVVELADYLLIDRFAVLGVSGGGPYALACAYKIPDRLTTCGIIAGEGPYTNPFFAQWLPWLLMPIMGRFFQNEERAGKTLLRFTGSWPESDRKSLAFPEIRDQMAASLVEGFRQGSKGPAYDGMLVRRPWGFELEDIAFPKLYLWHGELDKDVPVAMGKKVANNLETCKATYYPSEGHISVIVNYGEEILITLMS
jgi:pimeloyl-ACP methyl ester carboxylesterase